MKKYPFHLVTGSGRGVSYSSLTQVRDLAPGGPLGQAEIRIFYNLSGFNMSVADHVLKFPEINHPILLGYFFNSQCASVNTAWRLPISSFKPPSGVGTQFTFIEVDGHETLYTLQSNSKLYMAPAHSEGTPYLKFNESTGQWFRYHPGTQIGELYDKFGSLVQRRDRWGNQTNYGYDQTTGLLSSITGPSGTQYLISRGYRSDGSRSESIVVALTNGYKYNVQGYEFDKNGLLVTAYTSYNGQDLTNAYTTTYQYYSISPEPQIDSIQQSDGTLISFDYDTVSSGHYRLITIYLSQGAVRVDFNYSAGKTTAKVSGASGWQADFGYDSQSRITQVKQYTGYSSLNTYEITQYQYANDGHLQTIIYPDNSQETFAYSYPFGMRIQHQKPNGQQRNYYYDEAGDRPLLQSIINMFPGSATPVIHYFVQQRTYNSPNSNYPENETDYLLYKITPQGRVTAYDLYSNGLVQYQRAYLSGMYPSRYTTSAPSFQEMQNWRSQQNPQQINLSAYSYYDNGLQWETTDYATVDNTGAGINDQQMSDTTQYWDIYGKLLRQVKQEDRSVSPITTAENLSNYDGLQRTLQTIDPLKNTTTITYQANADKQYTGGVYVINLTQPNGRVEKTVLNDQGEKIVRAVVVPKGNDYSAAQTTQWYQDGTGRPTVIYLPDGRITFQSFDQNNRIGFTVSATGLVTEHQWDNVHNWQCDIVYENSIDTAPLLPPHDPTGNTIRAALTLSPNDRYTYRFYDASRRLRFEVDANNQATETQYDTLDRVTAKIRYATPLTDAQLNTLKTGVLLILPLDLSQDRCTSTYYDLDGKVIGQIDPDGWVTENKLDCAGQVSQQILYAMPNRNSRSADFNSMRPVISPNDAITYYFRNARGQVTVVVSPEGFVTAYQYYASTQVQQKTLFYNKVDPNWYQNTSVCPPLPAGNSEDQIKLYQYDLLERTINLTTSDGAARYREYTSMGKLSLERHYDSRYTTTAGNTNPDQTRTVQYRYDGWDNIVQTATPLVSQLMAENPDQIEQIWNNSSVRDQYDDMTAFKLKSTNTLGNTSIFYYDQERRPVLSVSPTGAVKQLTYNSFNDKILTRKYINKISAADLASLTGGFITQTVLALLKPDNAQDIIEQFTYDKLSQKINYLDSENYQSTYAYNSFGETITENLPLENKAPSLTINHIFNPRGKEITTQRVASDGATLTVQNNFENGYGKLTSKIDETGALTQYFYDREGVQMKTIDALGVTSHQYTMDALKRVLTDTDAQNQITRYQYNQHQRATILYPPVNNTQVTTQTNIFSQMVKRTDAVGAVRTESHAADGQTTAAVNELGLLTQDSVDTESRHISHVDPIGIQTIYAYDNDNYLMTQTQLKAYQNQDLITSYTRDTFGRAIFITNPRGMITQQLFSQRSLVLQKIRDCGASTSIPSPSQGEGESGGFLQSAQPLNLTKTYTYNAQGSKTSLIQGDAQNSNQYAVNFLQDGFNRAIGKIIDPDGASPLALTSRQALDGVNRTVSYTDAAGRITRLFYDALGHKRFAIDAAGGMIEWQYNFLALKSVVRKYETGLISSELAGLTDQTTLAQIETVAATKINAQDIVKYYFYDANQREQFTVKLYQDPLLTSPQGIVTQKIYDGASRLIQTIRYSNSVDAAAISTWTTAFLIQLVAANASADDRLTVIIVDAAGQQCFAVDPRGVINEQRFDALGRIISKIHYAAFTNPQTIAGFSLAQMSDYVANNIVDVNQDQSDNTVFNVFDKADYIVQTTVAPQCAVTQYPHDLTGNLTGTIRYKTPVTFSSYADLLQQLANLIPNPAQGDRITATAYDLCDRVINDTDELGYQNSYGRDALDNQISRTDRAGFVWQRSYDRGKRLITELTPEAPVNTVTANGNTITYVENNRSIKTVYGYDGVNNLLQKTVDADGDEPRSAKMTFWIHNQQNSITVQNVEVDDPAQAANLVTRPTNKQNVVTQTIFNFKLQTVVDIAEQGAAEFSVYDSLGRLAYKIDKINGVTAYTRNNFDEVIVESKLATPLKVDLTSYLTTGVPIGIVAANLIDSNDDRYTVTERDKGGNPITTLRGVAKPSANAKIADLTGLLFYFQPSGISGFYYTQHDRQFDAFNNIFRSAKLITPTPNESWSQLYQWFDGKGNMIASAEAVNESLGAPLTYRVNRIIYDVFYQKIQEIRYANYLTMNPDGMTLSELDNYLASHTSPQDRIKTYQYDLRGCLTGASRVNVNREVIAATNPPAFKTYTNITLTESYQYDPRQLKTLTIHEALPDQQPTQACSYYDSRGFERAHVDIVFTTWDNKNNTLIIAPLIYYGFNAHGQKVRKLTYINGAKNTTIDPQVLPTPLSPDSAADRLELKQTDARGNMSAEQDPNQRLTQSTYTLTGQVARNYWQLTNPGNSVHVDEKRQSYDLQDRVILIDLRRDNVSQLQTALYYNAFGDTLAEGPGALGLAFTRPRRAVTASQRSVQRTLHQDIALQEGQTRLFTVEPQDIDAATGAPIPGKSTQQWPLYRTVDQIGRLINTNDHKHCEILFYDLNGAQTAELVSPTLDLSIIEQTNFPNLLTKPYTDIEKTQFVRDPAKRLLAQILPEYTAGMASQPQYVPLEILAGNLYPALGAVSLSWVTPILNAKPVFYLYPASDPAQKMELTISEDHNSGRSGVDVSIWPSGMYGLEIDYYFIDFSTGLPTTTLAYYTDGQVYFPTTHNTNATVAVPTVQNDHVLWLTGAVVSATDMDLIDINGVTVNRYPLQNGSDSYQKFTDLSAEISGHYTARLVTNGEVGATTPGFVVNTATLPIEPIVSREIPATAQITLTNAQDAALSLWQTLPLDFQQTPVQMTCQYMDTNGKPQSLAVLLTPDANQTAALHFDYPVQSITTLTASLQVSADESVPLYVNQPPQTSSPTQINFASRRIVYIRGQAVQGQYTQPPTIQFKDVSQGMQAAWKNLMCTGATPEGITADVSGLAPGNYPFILPYGDRSNPYVFTLAFGAQVFDSSSKPQLKSGPVPRQRQFWLDVFKDNVVASLDTVGCFTQYQYNDRDQIIMQLDPPISVTDADGTVIPDFQGVTTTHRNVDGVVIGITLPAGKSQAYVLNEQNKRTQWVLGDGLVYMAYRRDGFNRSTIITDSRNLATQRVYDPVNMIQQIVPNNDSGNNNGQPLQSVIGYNEKNQRVLTQDPAGNQTLYQFTITGDIATRINPKGDTVTTTWDRNHQKLSEIWYSGKTQRWTPDSVLGYFSVMNGYQDLGEARYTYQYDWKLQQIVSQSQGGDRGNTAALTTFYDTDLETDVYALDTSAPVPNQNLQMVYDAGRLIMVNDLAQNYQTVLDYDSEDRPILKQINPTEPTCWSVRTITSTLDILGRQINFFDTIFSGFTQYDRNGNRRRHYGQVMQGSDVLQSDDNWYDYDDADRPIAVDCGFSNGSYQLTKSSSMFLAYRQGLRYQETAQDEIRMITYWDSGDIRSIYTYNLEGSKQSESGYNYHAAGYRLYTSTSNYNDFTFDTTSITCDADLFQTSELTTHYYNGSVTYTDTTSFNADLDNNITHQDTAHSESGSDMSYSLDFVNKLFEDTYQLSTVTGKTTDSGGDNYTEALMYYDSNGTLNGKVGADNDDEDTDGQLSIYNATTHDGLVIQKYQFPTNAWDVGPIETTTEYYFYDINNNYLSSYTFTILYYYGKERSVRKPRLKSRDTTALINMRYQGVKNPGKWGHCDLDTQPRTPRQTVRFNTPVALVKPIVVKINLHETEPPARYASNTTPSNHTSSNSTTDYHSNPDDNQTPDDGEFVQSINNINLLTVPDKYTVKPGDTFTSIAQSQYGDASFAEMVAIKNNYSSSAETPSVSSVLNLPQYIPQTNKFYNNLPYNTFQNAIYGNLYPPLIFAQPPQKQDCTQTLILVACAVTAIVTAPTVAGPMIAGSAAAAGVAATSTTAVVLGSMEVAVTAAALDASLQGVAVGVGALQHFSVDSVIETGVTAGMFYGVNAEWANSPFYVQVLAQTTAAGAADLSGQLIEMSVGTRKRLDINQTLNAMATTAVNAAIAGSLNPELKALGPEAANLIDDFVNAYVNAYIGSAIMGGKVDLENALGQALGSFTGQEAGAGVLSVLPQSQPVYDYQIASIGAKGINYQQYADIEKQAGMPDLNWQTCGTALTTDDIQVIGTAQLPKSTGQKLDPSVAQPNSYTANKSLTQQWFDQMLTANLSGFEASNGPLFANTYDPNRFLFSWGNTSPTPFVSPFPKFSGIDSEIIQMLELAYYARLPMSEKLQFMENSISNEFKLGMTSIEELWTGKIPGTDTSFSRWQAARNLIGPLSLGASIAIPALKGMSFLGSAMDDYFVSQLSWSENIFNSSSFDGFTGMKVLDNMLSKVSQSAKWNFRYFDYTQQAYSLDVSTKINSAGFWSGPGNRQLAEAYAIQTGKTTLEMTPGGSYFDSLNLLNIYTRSESLKFWEILSLRYAQGVSGNAWAFVEDASPGGIFNRIEYPTLQANQISIQYSPQIETIKNVTPEVVTEP